LQIVHHYGIVYHVEIHKKQLPIRLSVICPPICLHSALQVQQVCLFVTSTHIFKSHSFTLRSGRMVIVVRVVPVGGREPC